MATRRSLSGRRASASYLGRGVGPSFLVAFGVGTSSAWAIMLRKGLHEGRKTALQFGPFLALGGLRRLLAGDALVDLYLDTF